MSGEIDVWLVQECMKRSEPCVPELVGESWFSISFVAECCGYTSLEYFTKLINKRDIPRHPFQRECIRFSDLKAFNVQPTEDQLGTSDSV